MTSSAFFNPISETKYELYLLEMNTPRVMNVTTHFQTAYRQLEQRMKALAEWDGDVYLPNPEPAGPVDNVLICMEPSLGHWAESADDAKARVEAGFRNFLVGFEPMLLHFSVRRFLCKPGQRYHITDFSKGAMLVKRAASARSERYDRWYTLLKEEVDLIAKPGARIIAVGKAVAENLHRRGFSENVTTVIHYSSQAGRARAARIAGHEDRFRDFEGTVSHGDVLATARDVLKDSGVPAEIRDDALSRIARAQLSTSRRKLIFAYKLEFEGMNA